LLEEGFFFIAPAGPKIRVFICYAATPEGGSTTPFAPKGGAYLKAYEVRAAPLRLGSHRPNSLRYARTPPFGAAAGGGSARARNVPKEPYLFLVRSRPSLGEGREGGGGGPEKTGKRTFAINYTEYP